jgi:hypothetical protein
MTSYQELKASEIKMSGLQFAPDGSVVFDADKDRIAMILPPVPSNMTFIQPSRPSVSTSVDSSQRDSAQEQLASTQSQSDTRMPRLEALPTADQITPTRDEVPSVIVPARSVDACPKYEPLGDQAQDGFDRIDMLDWQLLSSQQWGKPLAKTSTPPKDDDPRDDDGSASNLPALIGLEED